MSTYEQDDMVPLAHYSAALDEIFQLRTLLAYEAAVRIADLDMKSYPRSRRDFAVWSRDRMLAAARGDYETAMTAIRHRGEKVRADARMSQTLTRSEWEQQRGLTQGVSS